MQALIKGRWLCAHMDTCTFPRRAFRWREEWVSEPDSHIRFLLRNVTYLVCAHVKGQQKRDLPFESCPENANNSTFLLFLHLEVWHIFPPSIADFCFLPVAFLWDNMLWHVLHPLQTLHIVHPCFLSVDFLCTLLLLSLNLP